MKRFIGLLLTAAGGAGLIWGIASLLTGSADTRVYVTPDFSVDALTGGLAGAAVFTLGLIWVRD